MTDRFGGRADVPSVGARLARAGGFVALAIAIFAIGRWAPLQGTAVDRTLETWLGHGWWTDLIVEGMPPVLFMVLVVYVVVRRGRDRPAVVDPEGTREFIATARPLGLAGAFEYDVRVAPDLVSVQPLSMLQSWRDWYRIPAESIESVERRGSGVVVRGTDLHHGEVELGLYLESKVRTDELEAALRECIAGASIDDR